MMARRKNRRPEPPLRANERRRWPLSSRLAATMLAIILVIVGIAMWLLSPAHGQNFERTLTVPAGTVLTVTTNGAMMMQQTVSPGLAHVSIRYVDHPAGREARPARRISRVHHRRTP